MLLPSRRTKPPRFHIRNPGSPKVNFQRSDPVYEKSVELRNLVLRFMGPWEEGKRRAFSGAGRVQPPTRRSHEQNLVKGGGSMPDCSETPGNRFWPLTLTLLIHFYPEWCISARGQSCPFLHPLKKRKGGKREREEKPNKCCKWIYRMHLAAANVSRRCQSKCL